MSRRRSDTSRKLTEHARLRNALAERPAEAFLDADEAAVYLGLARATIRNLIHAGRLTLDARGARRSPMFRRSTLDAFLAARAGTA